MAATEALMSLVSNLASDVSLVTLSYCREERRGEERGHGILVQMDGSS